MITVTSPACLRPGLAWVSGRGWSARTAADVARQAALDAGQPPPPPPPGSAAAVAADAAIAAALAGAPGEARSSKRARRERIIYVDGHAVLRLNNYSLAGGEPSVFAAELGTGRGGGGGGGDASAPPPPSRRPAPAPRVRRPAGEGGGGGGSGSKKRGGGGGNKEEVARQAHNRGIDVARAALAPRRAAFLEQHIPALEPFVTAPVLAHIRRMAAAAPKAGKAPPAPVHGTPAAILATLRAHQTEGLRWLSHMFHTGVNAILADEMARPASFAPLLCGSSSRIAPPQGLGKTLQTICLLAHLKFERHTAGPHLVVCPLSVLSSWMAELKRWCPTLRVVRLHSSDEGERARLRREVVADPSSFDGASARKKGIFCVRVRLTTAPPQLR